MSCSPGFNAFRFFAWFNEVRPTWYTAVPTMHQTILELAPRNKAAIEAGRLRFIRSSSSSLPGPVMTAMEAAFGVPVIESYGMTEAAHQMASNPLPPRPRFPGCVGIAAGPEVAIMDEGGALLPPGGLGEVVIRGRNVTAGYENNPAANAAAFTNGWFRTGDQGVIDADGYLRLTGRLKELINRGGEKVSPLEVDEILSDHPAVAQCLTFGLPHPKLGEEVAAAIVLRGGFSAKDTELRDFCGERLAPFKVPRKIRLPEGNPEGRHRQAAAHRPGGEAGADRREGCDFRRRSHRRLPRRPAGQGRGRRDVHRARAASGGDAGQRRHVALGRRQHHRASALRRFGRGSRRARLRGGDPEGARAAGGGAVDRCDDGAGQRPGHRDQRHSVLVFLRPRQPVSRPCGGKRRSGRAAVVGPAALAAPSAAWCIRRRRS